MQGYDAALKLLLQASSRSVMQQLTGLRVERWLNSEIPKVQTSHADLLGATEDGKLVHIELQSSNDADMALRMAEYALRIYRKFRKYPRQTVLYVGEARMRMKALWREPAALAFRYHLLDIRDLDGVSMLNSPQIEENLLSILTRLPDARTQVREVLSRIARLEEPARRDALARFLIISGLRRLAPLVEEESRKMPVLNDILDHEVIGPAILQGRREGREEGRQEGRQEGLIEASQKMLRLMLEQRFGTLPQWVDARLADSSVSQLDDMAVRILQAASLDDLFPNPR